MGVNARCGNRSQGVQQRKQQGGGRKEQQRAGAGGQRPDQSKELRPSWRRGRLYTGGRQTLALTLFFIIKFYWSTAHLFVYCLWLLLDFKGRGEQLRQRPYA